MQSQILGLINPAIVLLFAACFAFIWRRDPAVKYVAVFAFGYTMLAAGFLIFHFSPDPNGLASVLMMHAIYSAGTIAIVWAACTRTGISLRLPAAAGIAIIAAFALAATTFAENQIPRIYAANTCYGLIFALATQVLARAPKRDAIDQLILWLFAFVAAQFFIRPYALFVLEENLSALMYRDSVHYAVMTVVVGVSSLMLAMALVAACLVDQLNALKEETQRDLLTGLLVRKAFEEEAVSLLDRAQAEDVAICAIVADIDHFKQVNDIWGHQAGDNGIASFGHLVSEAVRDSDPVGRIGGEEFCILVWNCEEEAAGRLAERIRKRFAACRVDGIQDDVHLTASFGVAQWKPGEGYGKLFARADAALYRAKNEGRDCVRVGQVAGRASEPAQDAEAA